jgi:anti-sigma factor RsiW
MGKRLYFNREARRLLQAGVDELANGDFTPQAPAPPAQRERSCWARRRRAAAPWYPRSSSLSRAIVVGRGPYTLAR